MILELNLNEATMFVYKPEPEYESYETSEIVIPINKNIKLVISGCRQENNDYVYEVPPMANFVDFADEEDDELEENVLLIGNNQIINEATYILVNKNLITENTVTLNNYL